MIRKDYILRMIEMFGEMISGILGKIKKGQYEEAAQDIDEAYSEFLKEDASMLNNIRKEELTTRLLREHNYTNGHLEILSELLYAQAELSYAQDGREKSLEFYEKSLILLEFVVEESRTYSFEKESRIALIKDKIELLNKKVN